MSPEAVTRFALLQAGLAGEMARAYIENYTNEVRLIPSDTLWHELQDSLATSSEEEETMLLAKEYLLLMGILEVHPTEPSWVRVALGSPSSNCNRAGQAISGNGLLRS